MTHLLIVTDLLIVICIVIVANLVTLHEYGEEGDGLELELELQPELESCCTLAESIYRVLPSAKRSVGTRT